MIHNGAQLYTVCVRTAAGCVSYNNNNDVAVNVDCSNKPTGLPFSWSVVAFIISLCVLFSHLLLFDEVDDDARERKSEYARSSSSGGLLMWWLHWLSSLVVDMELI